LAWCARNRSLGFMLSQVQARWIFRRDVGTRPAIRTAAAKLRRRRFSASTSFALMPKPIAAGYWSGASARWPI
jgi:hypothetical protein